MIQAFEIGLPLGRRALAQGPKARPRFRARRPPSLAVRLAVISLLGLALAALTGGPGASTALAAAQATAGCKGVTEAVIPAQGVISNPGQTEGGHFWWRAESGGTCVGTVVEDVQVSAQALPLALRVIVFDSADPGGLTVSEQQIPVTVGSGPVSRAFGIHQVFAGLTEVCLAATSPVVPSPDLPCAQLASPPAAQQFTQGPGTSQPQQLAAQQSPYLGPWWPWP
jgi:hypothetical protein